MHLDSPEFYSIGWVSALPIERAAATALLNERHDEPEGFVQHQSDANSYTWGRIGKHNIVIASLPAGVYGVTSSASTISGLIYSLPHIKIGLLVGIGGGIARPDKNRDIRLGDIVVSQPEGTNGGVVQYDLGKAKSNQRWELTGSLDKPPPVLLHALANLQAEHKIERPRIPALLQAMWTAKPYMTDPENDFTHQGSENDRLFKPYYDHAQGDTCDFCDASQEVKRSQRKTTDPKIHYGVIASGNALVKNASMRDRILEAVGERCVCVEMEAAGLMDRFPCLVIRGICDYADSHKNDRWQNYASATAAAFAVDLLSFVPVRQLETTLQVVDVLRSVQEDIQTIQTTTTNTENEVYSLHTIIQGIDQKMGLDRLPIAAGAPFDSRAEEHNPTCLVNTRVDLLRQIHQWANDPFAKPIFWLNGMAGTGKSTISRTVARSCATSGNLGASFFFKRGEADRGNSSKFFTTIAAQLAQKEPSIASYIKAVIDADPNIAEKAARHQFEKLIMQPLGENIPPNGWKLVTLVLVVDALDECERDEDVKLIIHLFSRAKDLQFPKLRFFVTSRPDLPVRLGFATVKGAYQDLVLHEIPPGIIEHDISAFMEHQLAKIKIEYNSSVSAGRQLPLNWPGKESSRILVEMAIPLFIFAATVCRFLADRRGGRSPRSKLQDVLQLQTRSQRSKLDATYLPVLDNLVKGLAGEEKDAALQRFRDIIGPIVILSSPLSTSALGRMLEIPKETIDDQLDLLHSILSIPSIEQAPVRLLHLSFRDFLVAPKKSGKHPFWVDEKATHCHLAMHCLRVMNKHLKTDICEVVQPGTDRGSISAKCISLYLPPEMQYASLYWVHHIQQAGMFINDDGPVFKFLLQHFLHWLEALSLIGRASGSHGIIKDLQSVIHTEGCAQLASFLQDARRFILANITVLNSTPLQIYSSVLAFTPKNSVTRKAFFKENDIPKWICLPPEPENNWDQWQQILEGHQSVVNSVAFSHDSQLVVSTSNDRTIRLWRVEDGECIQELQGHQDTINSVAFSHDSQLVASGSSDNTIRLWSVEDGECIQELRGHQISVISVAFSHDSEMVASTSYDNTIRLWSVEDGECIQELRGHQDTISSVAFSHDSQLVASGSKDKTIRLWCVDDGECIQEFRGYQDWVFSVAFSHDSKLVASGSSDGTIRLWRVDDGECIQEPEGHQRSVSSVAFSHDSQLVASGSSDNTIRLWHVEDGKCIQELRGHQDWVNSVAFSHDSQLIASGSSDQTIRLWRVDDCKYNQELQGHQGMVNSVALSHDSQLVASGSRDNTIRLWRVDDGECIQELRGHRNSVISVAFSHDSEIVASTSYDNTIRLWSVEDGECIQELRGHQRSVSSVIFSHDSQLIASGSWDATIRLWCVDDGECIQELRGHQSSVISVAFSHDSQLVASTSYDNTIRLWSVEDGECIQELRGHQGLWIDSVAFSHDSQLVASGSEDKTIRLWSVEDGECIQELRGHQISVSSVAFSHDSQLVASGSSDQTIRLWRVDDGKCIQTVMHVATDHLEFDPSSSCLYTDSGRIPIINTIPGSDAAMPFTDCVDGIGISQDRCWLIWRGKRLLWLPLQFRPHCSVASGAIVAFGCISGRVIIMRFIEQQLRTMWQ